jgi:hypothetical protein
MKYLRQRYSKLLKSAVSNFELIYASSLDKFFINKTNTWHKELFNGGIPYNCENLD